MAVNKNRRTERAAVNALRSLLEAHDHIVQEIDGSNDHGEDLYVTFTEERVRTGDTVAVQVKGTSRKAGHGYRVPVGRHASFWLSSNVAIICVVHDLTTGILYWANASEQLREGARRGRNLRSVLVRSTNVLGYAELPTFVRLVRRYIADIGELHRFLSKISGETFDSTDYLSYFVNLFGERMIFQQRRGHHCAQLLHGDLGWKPEPITPDSLRVVKPQKKWDPPMPSYLAVGDVVIEQDEFLWIKACFLASEWHRDAPSVFAGA